MTLKEIYVGPNFHCRPICTGVVRVFFGGGAMFDLAAPRYRPLVGCTQTFLSRFHPGRGGTTVFEGGVQFHERRERKKIRTPIFAYLEGHKT